MKRGIVVLVLSLALPATISSGAKRKTTYVVGGWFPGTPQAITDTITPMVETYLTRELKGKFDPPIQFKFKAVDYDQASYSDDMIKNDEMDFLYSYTGRLGCIEVEFGWPPLVTQRAYISGASTGAQGGLIYSLLSNNEIKNLTDFRGKKIGVGVVLSTNSYHLGFQMLADLGINLYTDTAQLVFYGNEYHDQVRDVLSGHIDVGMSASSWLYVNRPNDLPSLRIHEPKHINFENEEFPFLTTTDLAPQFGISVSPNVPLEVKEAVADALLRLNRSNPEAVKMSIAGFEPAVSFYKVRNLLQLMGLLEVHMHGQSGGKCIQTYDPLLHSITCPRGYVRQSEEVMELQCKKDGLSCPSGKQCFCKPCILDHEVSIFPARTVLVLCCVLLGLALLCSIGWVLFLETYVFTEEAARVLSQFARRMTVKRKRPMRSSHSTA